MHCAVGTICTWQPRFHRSKPRSHQSKTLNPDDNGQECVLVSGALPLPAHCCALGAYVTTPVTRIPQTNNRCCQPRRIYVRTALHLRPLQHSTAVSNYNLFRACVSFCTVQQQEHGAQCNILLVYPLLGRQDVYRRPAPRWSDFDQSSFIVLRSV